MKDILLRIGLLGGLVTFVVWAMANSRSPAKIELENPPPLASKPAPTSTPPKYEVIISPEALARWRAGDTDERDDQIAELESQVKALKANQAILRQNAEQAQISERSQRTYTMPTRDGERIKITLPCGMEGQRIEMKTEDGRRVDGYIY
jgi:hypothetical protein